MHSRKINLAVRILFLVFMGDFCLAQAQGEMHPCAQKHGLTIKSGNEKTLTVQQELKANKYDISYYRLELNMTNQNAGISGVATINGKTIESLDTVILELDQNYVIADLRFNGITTNFYRLGSVLKIPVNLLSNVNFSIEIDYAGIAPPIASNPAGVSGVYNTFVADLNDRITFTISTPFYAHQWFPVKQVLRDKADSSTVILTVPSNCKAVSNGVLVNETDNGNGTKTFHYHNWHPIGYNLIFAAVAPFTEYNLVAFPQGTGGPAVSINNLLYGTGSVLTNMQAQCDLIPGFMELYSGLYGIYPFADQKYGIMAAPFGGGMEHQTMPTIGTFEKKVNAHELSHMWWGDKVGFKSFSDIWLSEGFATYSEYLMLEEMYPTEATPLLLGWHSNVKAVVSGSVYNTDTLDLYRIYNSRLSYKKAASIIHTLRSILDDDGLFYEALRNYLNEFSDSVGGSSEFQASIEQTTGLTLDGFFNEWLYGEGFPKYSTIWNTVGNDLYLEISHTASFPSVTPTFTNPIEIKFSRASGIDTTIRFSISSNQDQFNIPEIGQVTGVLAIDPNNWIINNNGTNTNDPNFVGLNPVQLDQVNLYPNPVNSELTIAVKAGKSYRVEFFNLIGVKVYVADINSTALLNLDFLPKGVYEVVISGGNSSHMKHNHIIKL